MLDACGEKQEKVILPAMWSERQENMMLPAQNCPPRRLQGEHMENRLRRPSGNSDMDFIAGSSRKRKSTAIDQPGIMYQSNFQYSVPREPNLQNSNSRSGAQVENNSSDLCLNPSKSSETTSFMHQFEEDHFRTQNYYPGSWQTSKGNFHGEGTENVSNASSRAPPQPLENKGLFGSLRQAGESMVVSNWQPQVHNMLGHSKAHSSMPFSQSSGSGSAQVASFPEELMTLGIKNPVTDEMPLGMGNVQSRTMKPVESLQLSFLKAKGHCDNMDGKTCSQEGNKSGICHDLRQSSCCSTNGGVNDIPNLGAACMGSSVCSEQNQNHILLQNQARFSTSGSLGVCVGRNYEKQPDLNNLKHMSAEEPSKTSTTAGPVENGQNDLTHDSLEIDEKTKSNFASPASVVSEKLWDGSLQLSSAVTVPAIAFFRSGEKLLDTNWSESVEVKGKVRLEAFEKYIQDLPRSRNRGMMVISLRWKEGSSGTGPAGMKEVAKGYQKGERVGFAKLSPGVDLYICPRSDAIITILAKYGFFKGMTAFQDNQDSLIGCVVWRKNHTSSNPVMKKRESHSSSLSEQPLNSPSDSPVQQGAEKQSSVMQITTASTLPISATASSNIEVSAKSGTASVPIDPISVPAGPPRSVGPNFASLQVPQGDMSEFAEQPKASLELQKSIVSYPSEIPQEIMTFSDDDDLPEFDFTSACGISQTKASTPADTVLLDNRHNEQAITIPCQRSDNPMLPRVTAKANDSMPPLNKFCELEHQTRVFPSVEERPGAQNKVTPTVFTSSKNLFDDDDDMPEWCPPELQRQSSAGTARPSITVPSQLSNPTLQTSARAHPRPFLSPPFPGVTRPPYSSQGFPPSSHSPTTRAPKAGPPERRISSLGCDSKSILGPPPSVRPKLPFSPAAKRHRRPL